MGVLAFSTTLTVTGEEPPSEGRSSSSTSRGKTRATVLTIAWARCGSGSVTATLINTVSAGAVALMCLAICAGDAGSDRSALTSPATRSDVSTRTYPPPGNCLPARTSTNSVTPPAVVQADFEGVAPNSSGTSKLFSDPIFLGTWTANSLGAVHTSVTIPANAPVGQHTLAFTGTDPSGAAVTFTAPLTINGSGSGLPLTGTQIGAASILGVGLLGAGTVAVIAGRRRRVAALPA